MPHSAYPPPSLSLPAVTRGATHTHTLLGALNLNFMTAHNKCTEAHSQLPSESASTCGWVSLDSCAKVWDRSWRQLLTLRHNSRHPPGCICLARLNKIMDGFRFKSWKCRPYSWYKIWFREYLKTHGNVCKKIVFEVGDISVSFKEKLKWSVERFSVSRMQHF